MKTESVIRSIFVVSAVLLAVSSAGVSAQPERGSRDQQTREQGPRDQGGSRRDGRAPPFVAHYPEFGHRVPQLPDRSESLRVGRDSYGYHAGVFYRLRSPNTYVVVRAPIGARVHYLPLGYVGFYIGTHRYFYANFTYYLWDPMTREYVVVVPPEGADAAVAAQSEQGSSELFVYPKEGQSEDQQGRDRYECYVWAVDQTNFDPSAANPDVTKAADYRRALSACLEGRGYTVK
jgi:hypothetical protein